MTIINIISKSLKETFTQKRFIPFFLLYIIFSISVLIFAMPILYLLPSLLSLQFTNTQIAVVMVNVLALMIVFVIVVLTNIWFTGALVFSLSKKRNFNLSLNYPQKLFWQMLLLSAITFTFALIFSFLKITGLVLRFLVDWLLMFSLPAIIIYNENVSKAIKRSFGLIKKMIIPSFVFWFFVNFINLLLLSLGIFFITASLTPLVSDIAQIIPFLTQIRIITNVRLVQLVATIIKNYPSLILVSVIFSFFVSVIHAFTYTARTYYFLRYSKKR